ncbi:MAG: hypothetical protein II889_00080 [Clostridia bacterium]|nr:hypothetical protein [Clostridia bacterium]
MDRDKRIFLDFLQGHGTAPVLFEPFLSRRHTETLIWRRGQKLWDTAEHTVSTLVSQTERTRADMLILDLRPLSSAEKRDAAHAIRQAREANPSLGFAVIGETEEDVSLSEESADALCLCGDLTSDRLPVIRMDGTVRDAIRRGDAAWFARADAEDALREADGRIRICGGLGIDRLASPAEVYERVERLSAAFGTLWAVGSGGEIPDGDYLGLIAMLGAYARVRDGIR